MIDTKNIKMVNETIETIKNIEWLKEWLKKNYNYKGLSEKDIKTLSEFQWKIYSKEIKSI